MAEQQITLETDAAITAEDKAADELLKKHRSTQLLAYAYVDPDSVVAFDISSRIRQFFDIDRKPQAASGEVKIYGTSTEAPAGTAKKRSTIDGVGVMQKIGAGKRIYKAIRIPTGGKFSSGKKDKKFKFVTLRVPRAMNLNAIALWLNTCFRKSDTKPKYFITENGMRCYLDDNYKDKGKLRSLKEVKA